jgi:two-component sensor histidine kinase
MTRLDTLRRSWRAWLSSDERQGGPWWAGVLWTLAFGTACAIGFTILGIALNAGEGGIRPAVWWSWFQANMVISLTIAATIRVLLRISAHAIGLDRLRSWSRARRSVYYTLVPLLGVAIGWPLGMQWALGTDLRSLFSFDKPGALIASVAMAVLITMIFQQFFAMKTRQIQAENQATEAHLRLLQAQIEPHFLFNTLANVVSLMEADPPRARVMLESFVDYLRASLTGLGQATHTLGDEIDLVDAYLRIIKIRMDDRLRFAIDVPTELRARLLPALSLQPLVENAIVHGIEPQIRGGTIRIAARLEHGTLVLTVEDDGAGIDDNPPAARAGRPSPGSGTALTNIRERLRQSYGSAAGLRLDRIVPQGVRASLSLPASS